MTSRSPVHAPEFPDTLAWIQGGPLRMSALRGRPVLIDFWDYTCINCIRTLPYLREWHARYSEHGLVIVGAHAPEFAFARARDNVARAIHEFSIDYPVVLDNDFALWNAYANRYWPAKYLVDKDGYIRAFHFGEGAYDDTERAIQQLIAEARPGTAMPETVTPLRAEDRPGAVCYRVTPELYLGYSRGRIGNPTGIALDKPGHYSDPRHHSEGFAYFSGDWLLADEYVERPADPGEDSRLIVPYMSKEMNLVIYPPRDAEGVVDILQDGKPLTPQDAGEDVHFEDGRSFIRAREPRMYYLINNREIGSHELTLITHSDGIRFYAFTFVACITEEEAA